MPPVFKRKIQPLEINVGDLARFDSEIEDAPNVNFKWFKSGTEIRQGEKYRIISHLNKSSLEIMKSGNADSGEYTCKATNPNGSDRCSAYLTVSGKCCLFLLQAAVLAIYVDTGWSGYVGITVGFVSV